MPDPVQDPVVMPDAPSVTVGLEAAHSAFHSLFLLQKAEHVSGFDDWVTRTAAALTSAEREMHELVMFGFHYAVLPERSWPSFPAYVDHLAKLEPVALRDKMLRTYARIPPLDAKRDCGIVDEPLPIDLDVTLGSVHTYLDFLKERFEFTHSTEEVESKAYTYVVDPPAMQEVIVSHLRKMWTEHLAPEWERVEPMLQDAVKAFQQVDVRAMSRLDAAQLITGHTLEEEKWGKVLDRAKGVRFVPSAHVGPYLGKLYSGDILWVLFGARLPEGVSFHAPALSRAEIIVRLTALADDNRLRILKLLSEEDELRSQDIMKQLDLSQSAASRHLKQLSATGYLSERRCNGAKCYALNPKRVKNTLDAISSYLLSK